MQIDGLNKQPEPDIETIGIFKLKDKEGRNGVEIDFAKAKRPMTEALKMFLVKMHGENNKIKVMIEWKEQAKEVPPAAPTVLPEVKNEPKNP